MSKTNKHRVNQVQGLSLHYMQTVLGPWKYCPRRNCSGTMCEVLARYQDKGKVYHEQECSTCGKVIRDPQWKIDRDKERAERKKWKKNRGSGYNRNYRRNNAPNNQRTRQR